MPVVISNGLRAAGMHIGNLGCLRHHGAYGMHIQQSGRSLKAMNAKNTKQSPIHANADANITCGFGDPDLDSRMD